MLLVGRPQSFLEPNLQPGKPPVLTCLPVLILVLSSGFSMQSRAKKTPPKTLLFPIALALLTLPTTLPLIFAHVYLKRHPVPRAVGLNKRGIEQKREAQEVQSGLESGLMGICREKRRLTLLWVELKSP